MATRISSRDPLLGERCDDLVETEEIIGGGEAEMEEALFANDPSRSHSSKGKSKGAGSHLNRKRSKGSEDVCRRRKSPRLLHSMEAAKAKEKWLQNFSKYINRKRSKGSEDVCRRRKSPRLLYSMEAAKAKEKWLQNFSKLSRDGGTSISLGSPNEVLEVKSTAATLSEHWRELNMKIGELDDDEVGQVWKANISLLHALFSTSKPDDIESSLKKLLPRCTERALEALRLLLTEYVQCEREGPWAGVPHRGKAEMPRDTSNVVSLAAPLTSDEANEIWSERVWKEYVPGKNKFSPEQAMLAMLEEITFPDWCVFKFLDVTNRTSVCGPSYKPDLLLTLKSVEDSSLATCDATGAIISLHSEGSRTKYDHVSGISKLLDYGEAFLSLAGSMRKFVYLGITDLLEISWFRLSAEGYISRSPKYSRVRESLCKLLVMKPEELGMLSDGGRLVLPTGCRWLGLLGEGRTSVVHEVWFEGTKYALKAPKESFDLSNDVYYLEKLKGINGIPTRHQKVLAPYMLISPVGDRFTGPLLRKYDLQKSLPDLVDILQAAHGRLVVNRDIRLENFMIGTSDDGKQRLFILDWGYAERSKTRTKFCGSIKTASDRILNELLKSDEVCYEPGDDLVSLIRCLFIFFHEHLKAKLLDIESDVSALLAFWNEQFTKYQKWKKDEDDAIQGDYRAVKEFLEVASEFF